MTKIKICGLTSPAEAYYLNSSKADFAGFVLFFPKSKRNITIEQAKEIFKNLSSDIKKVAVTVSPTQKQIDEITSAGFDYIQIHSEIEPQLLSTCSLPILKAFNVSDIKSIDKYRNEPNVCGYVFDAAAPGSGKTFDWNTIKDIPRDNKMFILAGGLNSFNVSQAIAALSPDCVDVSSGVEKNLGGKDPKKICLFAAAVRGANVQERISKSS